MLEPYVIQVCGIMEPNTSGREVAQEVAKTTSRRSCHGLAAACARAGRRFQVAVDRPKQLGGTDRAMNLVELLLCSLGGCALISPGECDNLLR